MSKDHKIEEMKKLRPFRVFAIEQGTVIDHIPAGKALTLVKVLKLPAHNKIVTLGLNFKSKKGGHKDIVKVEGKELSQEEVNQVAILVPTATINIIRNYKVADKFKAEMPKMIEKLLVCPNPNCITRQEEIVTKFYPAAKGKDEYDFRCHYCERMFPEEEIIEEIGKK